MSLLNGFLGHGPVPVIFFSDLVTVRDSVIHGDSKAEWNFPANNPRRVTKRYISSWGDVELNEEQLKEALANSTRQVKCYDEKLNEPRRVKPIS